jgi:hypothetical protein
MRIFFKKLESVDKLGKAELFDPSEFLDSGCLEQDPQQYISFFARAFEAN